MNRRGFLSLLGIGTAGLVAVESVPKWMVYEPAKIITPEIPIVGLDAMTAYVAQHMEPMLKIWKLTDAHGPKRLGESVGGITLDSHRYVCARLYPEREIDWKEVIGKPVAETLANYTKRLRVNVFGKLPTVYGGTQSSVVTLDSGLSVRGCMYYDVGYDEQFLRFDVLGGRA